MSTSITIEKQILATIVYYDILDYPLTSFEVFLYLVRENRMSKNKTEFNSEASELNSVLFLLILFSLTKYKKTSKLVRG